MRSFLLERRAWARHTSVWGGSWASPERFPRNRKPNPLWSDIFSRPKRLTSEARSANLPFNHLLATGKPIEATTAPPRGEPHGRGFFMPTASDGRTTGDGLATFPSPAATGAAPTVTDPVRPGGPPFAAFCADRTAGTLTLRASESHDGHARDPPVRVERRPPLLGLRPRRGAHGTVSAGPERRGRSLAGQDRPRPSIGACHPPSGNRSRHRDGRLIQGREHGTRADLLTGRTEAAESDRPVSIASFLVIDPPRDPRRRLRLPSLCRWPCRPHRPWP